MSFSRLLRGRSLVFIALCASVLVILPSCSLFNSKPIVPKPAPQVAEAPKPPEPEPIYCDVNLDFPLSGVCNPRLYVFKTDRRMLLVQDKTLVRDYRIALGPSPSGDKYFRGDGRTPEGEYFICMKNPASKYYKSLGLNYPTSKHAEEALETGMISLEEYKKILNANEDRRLPPPNTSLGGAIFIHGGGTYEDWTLGCVAVSNSAMDELFQIITVGTPVKILP